MRGVPSLTHIACVAALVGFAGCTAGTEVGSFDPNNPNGGGANNPEGGTTEGGAASGDGDATTVPASPEAGTPIPAGKALLRIINASFGISGGAIDVCLMSPQQTVGPLFGTIGKADGTPFLANAGYFEVPSGDWEMRTISPGLPCTQTPLVTPNTVHVTAGDHATALLYGGLVLSQGLRPPKFTILRDDVTPSTDTTTKVRFIHAAPELDGPIDLEWRLTYNSSLTYSVALTDAPFGSFAKGSPLGPVSPDGYASIGLVASGGSTIPFRFRSEGVTLRRPGSNTFRTIVNSVQLPSKAARASFTVIVVGADVLGTDLIDVDGSFAACIDDDTRANASAWSTDTCVRGYR